MVVHCLHAHRLLQAVEGMGAGALEPCVGLAAGAYAVHHLAAIGYKLAHHLHDGLGVVLKVGVDRYRRIAVVFDGHQAGK